MEFDNRYFVHQGREYEIRIMADENRIKVKAFLDGKPANGYSYMVEDLTQRDAAIEGGIDPLKALVDTAQRDVENGVWEQYQAVIKSRTQ
ncbi:hypothetical protein [Idiomarina xiamenensis]|uniref:Uncharacterized protein n=1 Tax=Idiomarina xiamenensis 10-D-4 TaxID=740709 RepID=K2K6R0_9GAMM|nr:hypothetical protein [Idiomarina xiamenensis]EKE83333.1 hypothetical protein A10D4_07917 [Idiomarina xiamenensis 10-D-4]